MISKEEIQGLALLARIEVGEGEMAALQGDISDILAYVGQISALGVGGAEKTASKNHNVLRPDTVREAGDPLADKRDAMLAGLPAREGDFVVVRKIIQKDA